jgi:hypothetical protein
MGFTRSAGQPTLARSALVSLTADASDSALPALPSAAGLAVWASTAAPGEATPASPEAGGRAITRGGVNAWGVRVRVGVATSVGVPMDVAVADVVVDGVARDEAASEPLALA